MTIAAQGRLVRQRLCPGHITHIVQCTVIRIAMNRSLMQQSFSCNEIQTLIEFYVFLGQSISGIKIPSLLEALRDSAPSVLSADCQVMDCRNESIITTHVSTCYRN